MIPDIAVDPRTGALYVVTQQLYDLPNGPLDPGINLFTSTDGGPDLVRPGAGRPGPDEHPRGRPAGVGSDGRRRGRRDGGRQL